MTTVVRGVRTRRRGGAGRTLLLTLLAVVVVVLLALAWVGWRAQQAVAHLQSAADRVPALTSQLSTLDVDGARSSALAMQADTSAAVALTDDPVWGLLERFPLGGQNLRVAAAGARAADRLATQGAGSAVDAAAAAVQARDAALSLDLAGAREGAARAQDSAASALAATTEARGELDGLDRRFLIPPAASALNQVETATEDLEALGDSFANPLEALAGAS